jgi:hypothetical protein
VVVLQDTLLLQQPNLMEETHQTLVQQPLNRQHLLLLVVET